MPDVLKLSPITPETKLILENLMSMYMHDLSEFSDDLKISRDGRFVYEGLDLYLQRDDLLPFFIEMNDEILGFILLNTGKYVPQDINYNVHEFFILKGYRRKGIGAAAAKKLFEAYPGTYKIEQLADNMPAINFWKRLYTQLGIEFVETVEVVDDEKCYCQVFSFWD